MTKTIEEAANEYADNAYYPAPDYNWYESDDKHMKECLADTFKAGANHVYELPLSSRMTTEEKKRVRKEYGERLSYAAIYKKKLSNSVDAVGTQFQSQHYQFYVAQIKLLECIFGKDFFKKGE